MIYVTSIFKLTYLQSNLFIPLPLPPYPYPKGEGREGRVWVEKI